MRQGFTPHGGQSVMHREVSTVPALRSGDPFFRLSAHVQLVPRTWRLLLSYMGPGQLGNGYLDEPR